MARDIWFISDTHFGHANAITNNMRPFDDVDHMNNSLIENWSNLVKPQDLIYHLGDISWNSKGLSIFEKLPGTKRLTLGNHDSGVKCAPLVQKMYLFRRFSEFGFTISHMPIRSEERREEFSVHGHMHNKDVDDPYCINVCVEKTDYAPIHMDELLQRISNVREAL